MFNQRKKFYRKRYKRSYRKPSFGKRLWNGVKKVGKWYGKQVGNNISQVSSALGAGYKALSLLNVEYKLTGNYLVDQAPSSTPVVTNLMPLTLGTAYTDRIGNHVKYVGTHLRGNISLSTGMSETCYWRLLIVKRLHNESNSNPAVTDVLSEQNSFAMRNIAKFHNFKVLYDKTFMINSNRPSRQIKVDIRKKLPIKWDSNVSATHPVYNGLYMMWFSNQTTNLPVLNIQWRSHYIDN